MKSWSIDSQYRKKSPKLFGHYSSGGSGITTPTGLGPIPPLPPPHFDGMAGGSGSYHRRYINYGTKRNLKQSPREEHRLQTSCSLPETPIFARGCDIPRTPYRRQNEPLPVVSGSRTAPRSSTSNSISMGASILGIGGGNYGTAQICRQRSINHALASNEMLRMTGAPARGWYPKQRGMRPVSTENIDRLASMRVWDNSTGMSGTGQSRKPLTLPPNLTPSFLNKSPREALRRVTSLLITKKKSSKDRKHKTYCDQLMDDNNSKHVYEFESGSTTGKDTNRNDNGDSGATTNNKPKKKGLFKSLWKRSKTVSLDQ
ncbi:GD21633 [Drosophila simulans]|uniref:GD21633 n=2 Tax=Drosophila simulans TaxID=7240 RepID=B4Q4F4_DROSI|nr:GD21633 [Drosophila simulans]